MSFIIYDIIFLVLFTLFVVIFLYKRRHNLKREGLLYLYRTKLGVKFIESSTKKYSKFFKLLEYPIVVSGYALMLFGIWIIIMLAYNYITSPYIAKALKIPVVMPLIPYLPELFKIEFLPPFYFTYWILIIAVIAIPHEFSHGIFARLNKIKILSTGFGFLGPFLAAFVEQDDKQMQKSKKFSQLAILAAGTFANLIVAILFGLILLLFFISTFTPAGISFNMYATTALNLSSISSVSLNPIENSSFVRIEANNKSYFIDINVLNESLSANQDYIFVFDDSPAFNARLSGAITEIDGNKILSYQDLNFTLSSYKPGDNITITTIDNKKNKRFYNITLGERDGKAFLGIGMIPYSSKGIFSIFNSIIEKVKAPFVYYESVLGDLGVFILNLLWWIVMVSLSVALMNMLPLGIFDGGRFFFLTIWSLTGSRKIGERAFKFSTWFFLALIAVMIIKWFFIFI
ncbi:MAG: site-2 protease family protein [Candidatus Pacearchaeota archaeon]